MILLLVCVAILVLLIVFSRWSEKRFLEDLRKDGEARLRHRTQQFELKKPTCFCGKPIPFDRFYDHKDDTCSPKCYEDLSKCYREMIRGRESEYQAGCERLGESPPPRRRKERSFEEQLYDISFYS